MGTQGLLKGSSRTAAEYSNNIFLSERLMFNPFRILRTYFFSYSQRGFFFPVRIPSYIMLDHNQKELFLSCIAKILLDSFIKTNDCFVTSFTTFNLAMFFLQWSVSSLFLSVGSCLLSRKVKRSSAMLKMFRIWCDKVF